MPVLPRAQAGTIVEIQGEFVARLEAFLRLHPRHLKGVRKDTDAADDDAAEVDQPTVATRREPRLKPRREKAPKPVRALFSLALLGRQP